MKDWEKTTLGEVANFSNGNSPPSISDSGKYALWGSNGIIGYANQSNASENSLVIGRVGSYCGSTYYSSKPCWVTDNAIIGRCKENISDAKFLYYFLSNYKLDRLRGGSGQPLINQSVLSQVEIKLPLLNEQKQIAAVLSCFDHKIENLRKQNETLEAIAQTLFKHWFVDFEFPNEDGKPYKSSGCAMERSELGEIPAGWSIGALGDFCNIKHGYAFKGEFITTDETDQILLTPGNFRIGGGFNSSKYKYYSDNNYDQQYILESGDLIVTMTDLSKEGDTLGYPAFVPKNGNNGFLHNQRLGKVVDSKIDLFFLFFLLCRREYRSHILGTASGSTVRHTSPSRILEYKFTVPTKKLLDQFCLIVSKLIGKSFSNCEQISTLDKTRDMLLPKLMSGQIRIDHMEED